MQRCTAIGLGTPLEKEKERKTLNNIRFCLKTPPHTYSWSHIRTYIRDRHIHIHTYIKTCLMQNKRRVHREKQWYCAIPFPPFSFPHKKKKTPSDRTLKYPIPVHSFSCSPSFWLFYFLFFFPLPFWRKEGKNKRGKSVSNRLGGYSQPYILNLTQAQHPSTLTLLLLIVLLRHVQNRPFLPILQLSPPTRDPDGGKGN